MKRFFKMFFLFFALYSVSAGEIKQMEFVNQSIKDILFTLARATGVSIITDDTITGTASYHFTDTDLDTSLHHFLAIHNMYFWKKDGIYYVSKVLVTYTKGTGLISLFASDVEPRILVEKIAKKIQSTILFDPLPREKLTIQAEKLPVYEVLEMIMHRFDNYKVENLSDYYYIKKQPVQQTAAAGRTNADIKKDGTSYTVEADSVRLSDVLSQLFKLSGNEYSLMKRGDAFLKNIHFKKKSFNTILRLLLEQADGDFTIRNGIYYIFDISRNEILKKMNTVDYIKLRTVPVELLPALFPSRLASSSIFKIDKENNAIILSGSSEETAPIKNFIAKLEAEYKIKHVVKLKLSYLTADELVKDLPPRLQKLQILRTGDPYTLILDATKEQIENFTSFLNMIDKQGKGRAVALKYIRAKDLLKYLPPSLNKNDIIASNDPNLLFFKGTDEKFKLFLKDLEYIDTPIPQIRYELLVVQYQESRNKDYNLSAEATVMKQGAQTTILGALGNLLNVNLDIVSAFGYQFALDLNAKLSDSDARILADTTLNGLTGENISFQNTNTYRYRDMEIDPDTGKATSTGVTREITSGLIITINGWVSGDDMITMNVKSTVSKRGADVSQSSGNPPPTSEKVINTHVRTPSGKPVVIGGLLQQEKDVTVQKTPVLSSIPLVGPLFTSRVSTLENTELVIYIVPHLEYPDREKENSDTIFKNYYNTFLSGSALWH